MHTNTHTKRYTVMANVEYTGWDQKKERRLDLKHEGGTVVIHIYVPANHHLANHHPGDTVHIG